MACGRSWTQSVLLLQIFITLLWLAVAEDQCVKFNFPTAERSGTLKATLNSSLHIPFSINMDACSNESIQNDITITVSKVDKINGYRNDICKLILKNGSCSFPFREECVCPKKKGAYSLRKMAELEDETDWVWRASGGPINVEKWMKLFVNYPAKITKLSLVTPPLRTSSSSIPEVFPAKSTVFVVCEFQEGKPKGAHPEIFIHAANKTVNSTRTGKRHTRTLSIAPTDNRGEVIGRVEARCQDSGEISCRKSGASQNKTALLLVECPLQFMEKKEKEFVVPANEPTTLRFKVRSHTKNITNCRVVKDDITTVGSNDVTVNATARTTNDDAMWDCFGKDLNVPLTGNPPHLTLALTLNKMTSQHVGRWELMVGNAVGSDVIRFRVQLQSLDPGPDSATDVKGNKPSGNTRSPTDDVSGIDDASIDEAVDEEASVADDDDGTGVVVTAVVIVVVAVVIICAVVIVVIFVRRKRVA